MREKLTQTCIIDMNVWQLFHQRAAASYVFLLQFQWKDIYIWVSCYPGHWIEVQVQVTLFINVGKFALQKDRTYTFVPGLKKQNGAKSAKAHQSADNTISQLFLKIHFHQGAKERLRNKLCFNVFLIRVLSLCGPPGWHC